jgi:hypothetical protein
MHPIPILVVKMGAPREVAVKEASEEVEWVLVLADVHKISASPFLEEVEAAHLANQQKQKHALLHTHIVEPHSGVAHVTL